ncbi:MAG: TldD/PmbA family protein [Candidatus Woesearchaeota archaeon]
MQNNDEILKTLEENIEKWMSISEKRNLFGNEVLIKPAYIGINHLFVRTFDVEYKNGVQYEEVWDDTDSYLGIRVLSGDPETGFGSGFDANMVGKELNALHIKNVGDKMFRKLFYESVGAYFRGHEHMSYKKLPVINNVRYNPKLCYIGKMERNEYIEEIVESEYNKDRIIKFAKRISEYFSQKKFVNTATVNYEIKEEVKRFISSEGSRIQITGRRMRLNFTLEIKDIDGRPIEFFTAITFSKPGEMVNFNRIINKLEEFYTKAAARYDCPIQEAGSYPVLLDPAQMGTLFHEAAVAHLFSADYILNENLSTFNLEKLNRQIMPEFISLYDNPILESAKHWNYFKYDDEGVATSRKQLVENGVLKNYLTDINTAEILTKILGREVKAGNSRLSLKEFTKPEPRISNLEIETSDYKSLKEMEKSLIRECEAKNLEYGIFAEDFIRGFVNVDEDEEITGVNAVFPTFMERVYPDGRRIPIKFAHIIGSPHNMLQSIIMLGGPKKLITGFCGAESGVIPTSEVSPYGLMRNVEIVNENSDIERG